MHTYRVYFDDDSTCLVNARTSQEACTLADAMYPGSHAYKAERLD